MNDYVFVVQLMRDDGAIIGAPLAIFSELESAKNFVAKEYRFNYVGQSNFGYIYESIYNKRLVISGTVVRQ